MLPGLEGFHRCPMPKRLLPDVMVVQPLVVPQGVVQVQTGVEVAGAQQVGDAPVGAFGHTVGLGPFGPDHQSGMQSLRAMGPASTSRR